MALATLIAFLAAFEVLPGLHLATHGHLGAHHHDATGAIVRDDEALPHAHDERIAHTHRARHVYPRLPPAHDSLGSVADNERAAHAGSHGRAAARRLATARRALPTDASYLLATALEHGRGSLAHHAAALRSPSPIVTTPLPVHRRPTSVVTAPIVVLRSVVPFTARARGPPAAALAVT